MSYKDLHIWKKAREVSIEVHHMTLNLPKFEQFETASQIRRSSMSIRSNIVEGYGRKRYNSDFIKFLVYAIASKDETIDHLEKLYETKSLKDKEMYSSIHIQLSELGKMLFGYLCYLEKKRL